MHQSEKDALCPKFISPSTKSEHWEGSISSSKGEKSFALLLEWSNLA